MSGRQGGAATVELVVSVAVLLLPAVVLVGLLPTWVERQAAARVAAREAARTVAVAAGWQDGLAAARRIVDEVAANYGVDPDQVGLQVDGSLARGGTVTATVTVPVPALTVPAVGTVVGGTLTVTHAERVDDYRTIPAGDVR